jgi:hypothetical protein
MTNDVIASDDVIAHMDTTTQEWLYSFFIKSGI